MLRGHSPISMRSLFLFATTSLAFLCTLSFLAFTSNSAAASAPSLITAKPFMADTAVLPTIDSVPQVALDSPAAGSLTSITISATVTPNDSVDGDTTYTFVYYPLSGPSDTNCYYSVLFTSGTRVQVPPLGLPAGFTGQVISTTITSLTPSTYYCGGVIVRNSSGVAAFPSGLN